MDQVEQKPESQVEQKPESQVEQKPEDDYDYEEEFPTNVFEAGMVFGAFVGLIFLSSLKILMN